MPTGKPFWTAWRKFYVETLLARGESKNRIAFRLGVSRQQLSKAIYQHGLKPRELLEPADG